jgi:hypothetical protein
VVHFLDANLLRINVCHVNCVKIIKISLLTAVNDIKLQIQYFFPSDYDELIPHNSRLTRPRNIACVPKKTMLFKALDWLFSNRAFCRDWKMSHSFSLNSGIFLLNWRRSLLGTWQVASGNTESRKSNNKPIIYWISEIMFDCAYKL